MIRIAIDMRRRNGHPSVEGALRCPWAAAILLALVLSFSTVVAMPHLAAAVDATPDTSLTRDPDAEGLVTPIVGLWVGGDATFALNVPEGSEVSGELADVNLLARYEPTPRLSLFADLLLEDTFRVENGSGFQTLNGNLSIDRLYADWFLAPTLTLRVGKFLTPFGLWNPVRRAPLTWTVERPAVTEQTFPEHSTGLDFRYLATLNEWSIDAQLYGPAQDALPLRQSEETGLMVGGRSSLGHSLGPAYAILGLNAAAYEDSTNSRWAGAYGIDLDVSFLGNQLTAEFDYARPWHSSSSVYGSYVQDAIPLIEDLYGVLRIQTFKPLQGPTVTGELIGLFWRPLPFLILKADYQFADRGSADVERGFFASAALLF